MVSDAKSKLIISDRRTKNKRERKKWYKLKTKQQRLVRGRFVLKEVNDFIVTLESIVTRLPIFPSEEIHLIYSKICF